MKFVLWFCLLLVSNLFCKSCSYTIEQVIRDSVEKGLKSLTQLKRQLPDDMDEDSRELIVGMDKDYTTRDEVPDPVPTTARQAVKKDKTKIENKNCSCEIHKAQASSKIPKYLIDLNKHIHTGESSDTTTNQPTVTSPLHPSPTSNSPSKVQLNETHFELHELEFQIDAAMREVCPHYKDIPDLDIKNMPDVWQLSFYKAADSLSCFKIFLKKTSPQSRKRYKTKYTSFNDTIDWHECFLELGSTGKRLENRRHFLQGSKDDKGVLENIVLSQSTDDNYKIITLQDQAPDQWLVTKNLLLMRDCDSGDVAIFARIPSKPDNKELEEAMINFGEDGMNGTLPCEVHKDNDKVDHVFNKNKYYMLS